jgi:hypothetical protein
MYAAAMDRRVQTLVTGCRDLGTSRTPQPCSNAHAAPRNRAEALCAGFPTIVRRRFGELTPGSAGLVIANERLNHGPEHVNVMHFGGELNRVSGELQMQECKARQAAGWGGMRGEKTAECWTSDSWSGRCAMERAMSMATSRCRREWEIVIIGMQHTGGGRMTWAEGTGEAHMYDGRDQRRTGVRAGADSPTNGHAAQRTRRESDPRAWVEEQVLSEWVPNSVQQQLLLWLSSRRERETL